MADELDDQKIHTYIRTFSTYVSVVILRQFCFKRDALMIN